MFVCCCVERIREVNNVRLFVFQDALPLICGVAVNRQLFAEEEEDDDDEMFGLLTNDDNDDGVGC